MVLVGHTRDDLAETAAMRMARGRGRGDAGIPPATLYENSTWFVRPMLGTRRRDLRAFLAAQGIGWIDDPTNSDRRYERARTRLDLAALPDAEREIEALARRAENAAAMRVQSARDVAGILARHAAMVSPGLFRLAPDMLALDMPDAAVEALRIVIAIAGGSGHLPDRDRWLITPGLRYDNTTYLVYGGISDDDGSFSLGLTTTVFPAASAWTIWSPWSRSWWPASACAWAAPSAR